MNEAEKEAVEYFRERKVFDRILNGFAEKYFSFGEFCGKVRVNRPDDEDIEVLEGFLQRNFHGQKSITVSSAKFEKALRDSRFGDVLDAETLLQLYFEKELIYKKEELAKNEKQRRNFFEKTMKTAENNDEMNSFTALKWLKAAQDENSGVWNFCENEKMLLRGCRVLTAFERGQGLPMHQAVFAAKISGDPHYFDDGAAGGTFLEKLIIYFLKEHGYEVAEDKIFPARAKWKNYRLAGIERDDISNHVILSGVAALKNDGTEDAGIAGFAAENKIVKVPLSSMRDWSGLQCIDGEILIIENPSVFSAVHKKYGKNKSLMCMNGYPGIAELLTMSLLEKTGTKVLYSGDTDPEGLIIADKLKRSYKGKFSFLCMTADDYLESISDVGLSEARLKKLDNIETEELRKTAETVKTCKKAGYQENIIEKISRSAAEKQTGQK